MKLVPLIVSVGVCILFALGGGNFVDSAVTFGSRNKSNFRSLSSNPTAASQLKSASMSSPLQLAASNSAPRVKRGHGHGRSFTTRLAYSRINDSGQPRREEGHGHGGGRGGGARRNAIGEDGTHLGDFKSHGLGYEHKHGGQCEESKCGYNIRHCPHRCVFNSFTCGGGAAYDTCCC